jgi:hypothetical protein
MLNYGWRAAFAPGPALLLGSTAVVLLVALPAEQSKFPEQAVAKTQQAGGSIWEVAQVPGILNLGARKSPFVCPTMPRSVRREVR